ncbi:hypothetical protein QBC35DRAFT_545094 [Podospora australis]|uniref:SET domain-containing protein n=1 Tax=Podospora australis TaxID=1536484 RepID=A0AAN6WMR0_9PEZI|nr:hypothetical protein QBC35DRAFT_545094 [Podospora australis]
MPSTAEILGRPCRAIREKCLPGPVTHAPYPSCVPPASESVGSAWTHKPVCIDSPVEPKIPWCAFTNSNFQGKRGVSVISPKYYNSTYEVSPLSALQSIISSLDPHRYEVPPAAYEVKAMKDKGFGLVATKKLRRGSVFMVDYATILADKEMTMSLRREDGRKLLVEAIGRLEDPQRVLELAVSSKPESKVPIEEDVFKTNAFYQDVGARGFMMVFPEISRMNHACNPNALTRFNETDLSNKVTAFRDILPGEEITISYTPFNLPSQSRRPRLLRGWGFNCTCSLCSLPPNDLAASDARRKRVDLLGPQVIQLVEEGKFEEAIELNNLLMAAMEEEEMLPHMGDYFEIMGRLHQAMGKYAEAKGWYDRAMEEFKGFGLEEEEGVETLKGNIAALVKVIEGGKGGNRKGGKGKGDL